MSNSYNKPVLSKEIFFYSRCSGSTSKRLRSLYLTEESVGHLHGVDAETGKWRTFDKDYVTSRKTFPVAYAGDFLT